MKGARRRLQAAGEGVEFSMTGTIGASTLLLEGVLLALALIHFAWLGLIAGGVTLAVAVDALASARLRPVAHALAALGGPDLRTLAWLEVTGVLLLVVARALVPELPHSGSFWAASLLPLVGGVALAGAYRSLVAVDRYRALRPVLGLGGVGLAVGSAFVLWSGAGVLLRPESWPTTEPAWRSLLGWSGTGRFAEFTLLSLAATGILATVRAGRLEGPEAAAFTRRLGGRLAVACLVLFPLASLFTHFNLPAIALSRAGWGSAAGGVALAAVTTWLLTSGGAARAPARPGLLLGVTLALVATLPLGEQVARRSALRPVVLAGVTGPAARLPPAPPPPTQGAAAPPAAEGGEAEAPALGRAVFERVCAVCHRFDVRRVGPPLGAVLPKYRGRPERLKAFLRAPVKVDPAYPAMPPPKATDEELEAVTAWLLEEAR